MKLTVTLTDKTEHSFQHVSNVAVNGPLVVLLNGSNVPIGMFPMMNVNSLLNPEADTSITLEGFKV